MPSFNAKRLREARESAGLSREQLAINVGRSYPLLALYEYGTKTPSVKTLLLLADALDRPVGYFFEEGGS